MANNYLQFSFVIPILSKEEGEWWRDVETVHLCTNDCDDNCNLMYDLDGSGTDIALYEDDDEVHIYSEEYSNVEWVANKVCEFLSKFNRDDIVTFEWAETCSKMRVGEFGGGSVVISRSGFIFRTTYEISRDLADKLSNKRGEGQ